MDENCSEVLIFCLFVQKREAKLDPITDIFRTMHVTAFGLHRLEATAPWGVIQEKQTEEKVTPSGKKMSPTDLAHFAMLSRGNCWLSVEGIPEPIPLTGGDCFLLARGTSIVLRDSPRTRPRWSFREIGARANSNVAHYGGGGAPTTIVCGSFSFDRASLKPITQLLPSFILIKADQARTLALHNTMQALASEMAEQVPGSEVVATRLAEVLFIQVLRAHIASGPERNKGWLRAVFDPQMGTALSAIHDRVNTPWTVESLAEAAGMSRSAFAARFKELLGQTPLEYVTEWRMQKAMQLLQQRDKKLIDVARSVGYESDAAFSKAFKRVVGANPGEYLKRGLKDPKSTEADHVSPDKRANRHQFPNCRQSGSYCESAATSLLQKESRCSGEIRILNHVFLRQAAIPIRARRHPAQMGRVLNLRVPREESRFIARG